MKGEHHEEAMATRHNSIEVYTVLVLKVCTDFTIVTAISLQPKMGLPNAPEIAECDASSSLKWDYICLYRVQLHGNSDSN